MSTPLAATATTAAAGLPASAGLPLVNQALEPASVRNGSSATQKAYAAALNFEDMLVQQLSQSLTQASGAGEGEGGTEGEGSEGAEGTSALGGGEAANGELSSLLPQSLTEGVMSQGGLGLAQQLMPALQEGGAVGKVTTAGGTSAGLGTPVAPSSPSIAPSGGVAA
jgi:hypothetical protein